MGNWLSSNEQENPQTPPRKTNQNQTTPDTQPMSGSNNDNEMTPEIRSSNNYNDPNKTRPIGFRNTDNIVTPPLMQDLNGNWGTMNEVMGNNTQPDDTQRQLDFNGKKYLKYKAKYLSLKYNIVN
jgi:hypothetical protein